MLSLVFFALLEAQAAGRVIHQVRPVFEFVSPETTEPDQIRFADDDEFEYLATPVGLMRSRRFADPNRTVEVVAFAGRRVTAVAADPLSVYVLLGNGIVSTSPEPTILRSADKGLTFMPIDASLGDCKNGKCEYLVGHHIELSNGRIFVEAGGNALVSADGGQHWTTLHGSSTGGVPDLQICPLVFTVAGRTMVLGGECPLDAGWLSRGFLSEDRMSWATTPSPLVPHLDLQNRNVQFIRYTDDVWAGIEGALIHGGSFSIHYDLDAARYPYIRQFVETPDFPQLRIVGGFDKTNVTGYLAFSNFPGQWQDVSGLLPPGTTNVALLAQTSDGALLIGVQSGTRFTIGTIETGPPLPRRRAVSHR